MNIQKQIADNITVIYAELNNWGYEHGKQYPIAFYLRIRFYDKEYDAFLSHKRLLEMNTEPIMFEGPSALHDSLYRMLEDGDFKDEIIAICNEVWEYERDKEDEDDDEGKDGGTND